MPREFWAAIAVIVLTVIYGKLVEYARKRGIPVPDDDPDGDDVEGMPRMFVARRPHSCPSGHDFMPQMHTREMKIAEGKPVQVAMVDPSGQMSLTSVPAEIGVTVCDGVFCGGCGQRLVCVCGRTPVETTVLGSREEHDAVLSCCDNPFFVESDIPHIEAALGSDIPKA